VSSINPSPTPTPIVGRNCKTFEPVQSVAGSFANLAIHVEDEIHRIYTNATGQLKYHVDFGDGERILNADLPFTIDGFKDKLKHIYKDPGTYNARLVVDNPESLTRVCAELPVYVGRPIPPQCSELHIQSNNTNGSTEIIDVSLNSYNTIKVGSIKHNASDFFGGAPVYGASSIDNLSDGGIVVENTKDAFRFVNDFRSSNWSLELWAKPLFIQESNPLITNKITENGLGFDLGIYDEELKFEIKSPGQLIELTHTEDWVTGQWYHISVVRAGDDLGLYVTGEKKSSIDVSNIPTIPFSKSEYDLQVGFRNTNNYSIEYLSSLTAKNYIENSSFLEGLSNWNYEGSPIAVEQTAGGTILLTANKTINSVPGVNGFISQDVQLDLNQEYILNISVLNAQNDNGGKTVVKLNDQIIIQDSTTGDYNLQHTFTSSQENNNIWIESQSGSTSREIEFVSLEKTAEKETSLSLEHSSFQFQDIKLTQKTNYFYGNFDPPSELINPNCQPKLNGCPELHIQSDDEDQGTVFKDSGQYNYIVSNETGEPKHSSDIIKFGNSSLYFNGESSIQVVNKFNFIHDSLDEDWTIQFWVFIDDLDHATNQTFLKNTNKLNGFNFEYSYSTNSINFELFAGGKRVNRLSSSKVNYKIEQGKWYHVALIYNVIEYSLYIDGSIVEYSASTTNEGAVSAESNLKIGNNFNGYMQDIIIIKGNVDLNEIPPAGLNNKDCEIEDIIQVPVSCPELHLQSSGAEGDTNIENLGVNKKITTFSQGAAYQSRQALLFNESSFLVNNVSESDNSYLYALQENSLFIPTYSVTFAVETWVRFTDVSKNHTIFYQTDASESAYTEFNRITHQGNPNHFSIITYKWDFRMDSNFGMYNPVVNYNEFTSNEEIIANKWYHIALVKIGNTNTLKLYVNGEECLGQEINPNQPNIFLPAAYDIEKKWENSGLNREELSRGSIYENNFLVPPNIIRPYNTINYNFFSNSQSYWTYTNNSPSNLETNPPPEPEFNIELNIGRHRDRYSKDFFSDQKFYVQDFRVHQNTKFNQLNIITDKLSNPDDCSACPIFLIQSDVDREGQDITDISNGLDLNINDEVTHDINGGIVSNSAISFDGGTISISDESLSLNSKYQLNFWFKSNTLTFGAEPKSFIGFGLIQYGNLFISIGSEIYNEWDQSINYQEGDVVIQEDKYYRLISPASIGEVPKLNNTIWQEEALDNQKFYIYIHNGILSEYSFKSEAKYNIQENIYISVNQDFPNQLELYINGDHSSVALKKPHEDYEVVIGEDQNNAFIGKMQDIVLWNFPKPDEIGLVPSSLTIPCLVQPIYPNCSETSLLLKGKSEENYIYDYSEHNHKIQNSGNTRVVNSLENPIIGDASLYFDGQCYLSLDGCAEHFNFKNNFTIEFWFKLASDFEFSATDNDARTPLLVGENWGIFGARQNFGSETRSVIVFKLGDEEINFQLSSSIILNAWYHLAVCTSSNGALMGLIDGELTFLNSFSETLKSENLTIGRFTTNQSSYYFNGYIQNLFISDSHSIYSGPFELKEVDFNECVCQPKIEADECSNTLFKLQVDSSRQIFDKSIYANEINIINDLLVVDSDLKSDYENDISISNKALDFSKSSETIMHLFANQFDASESNNIINENETTKYNWNLEREKVNTAELSNEGPSSNLGSFYIGSNKKLESFNNSTTDPRFCASNNYGSTDQRNAVVDFWLNLVEMPTQLTTSFPYNSHTLNGTDNFPWNAYFELQKWMIWQHRLYYNSGSDETHFRYEPHTMLLLSDGDLYLYHGANDHYRYYPIIEKINTSTKLKVGEWYHIRIAQETNMTTSAFLPVDLTVLINGQVENTFTNTRLKVMPDLPVNSSTFNNRYPYESWYFGQRFNNHGNYFNGFIQDFRVTKGDYSIEAKDPFPPPSTFKSNTINSGGYIIYNNQDPVTAFHLQSKFDSGQAGIDHTVYGAGGLYDEFTQSARYPEYINAFVASNLKYSMPFSRIQHSSEKTLFGKTSIKINEGADLPTTQFNSYFGNPLAITAGKKSGDKGVIFYQDPWTTTTYSIPAFYESLRGDRSSYSRRYAVFPEFLYDDDIPFSIETFIYLKASSFSGYRRLVEFSHHYRGPIIFASRQKEYGPGLYLNDQGRLFIQYWEASGYRAGSGWKGFWLPKRIDTGVNLSIDQQWDHLVFFVDPELNKEKIKIFLNGNLEFEIDGNIKTLGSSINGRSAFSGFWNEAYLRYSFGKAGVQIGGSQNMYIQDFKLIQNQYSYHNTNAITVPTSLSTTNHEEDLNWDFDKDFTIDTWIKPTDFNGSSTIFKFLNKLMGDTLHQTTLTNTLNCSGWCTDSFPSLGSRVDGSGHLHLYINSSGNLILESKGAKGYNSTLGRTDTNSSIISWNIHAEHINTVTSQGRNYSHAKSLELNKWQHIAINRSNNQLTVYINGEKYLDKIIDLTLFFSKPQMSIGSDFGGSNFKGQLQDFRIINRESLYCGPYHHQKLNLTTDSCQGKDLECPIFHLQSDAVNGSTEFVDISVKRHQIINSGNTNHSNTQSKFSETSVFFNGSNNSLQILESKDFNLNRNFSIEFWIYKEGHSNINDLDYIFNVISNNSSISSYTDQDDNIHFAWNNTSLLSTKINSGWNHIALIVQNNAAALYLNAKVSKTYLLPEIFIETEEPELYIGSKNNIVNFSNIYLQDFRIINDVNNLSSLLPPTSLREVNCETVCPDLLIQSDNLNESNNFNDFSLNTKNININGNVIHADSSYVNPIIGSSSIYFPGEKESYLSLDYNPDLKLEGDFVIEFWLRIKTGKPGDNIIIESKDVSDTGWRFLYDSINEEIKFIGNKNVYILASGNNSIQVGSWYHVAFQSHGSKAAIFINGNEVDSSNQHDQFRPKEKGIIIGQNLDGYLQDIRIVNDEVLYNVEFSLPLQFHSNCFPEPIKAKCEDIQFHLQINNDEDDYYDKSGNNTIIKADGSVNINKDDKLVDGQSIDFTSDSTAKLNLNAVYRDTLNLNINSNFTIETNIKCILLEQNSNQVLLYNISNNISSGEPIADGDYIIGLEKKQLSFGEVQLTPSTSSTATPTSTSTLLAPPEPTPSPTQTPTSSFYDSSKNYVYIIIKNEGLNYKYYAEINELLVNQWFNLSIVNNNKEIIFFINGKRLAIYSEIINEDFTRTSVPIIGGDQESESYCSILKIESNNNNLNTDFIDSGKDGISLIRSDQIDSNFQSPKHVTNADLTHIYPLFGNSSMFFDNRIDKSGSEDVAISSFIECETEDLGLNNWSIDFWINPITWEDTATLILGENFRIGKKDKNSNQLTIEIIGVAHLIEDLPEIIPSSWTHIAFTYYGQILKCYINGSLSGTPYSG